MRNVVIVMISILMCSTASAQQCCSQNNIAEQNHVEQLVTMFQHRLKAELMQGLQDSPIHAIDICQTRAQQIASELSTAEITIGRASDKPRNSDAQIPKWVVPLLEKYSHIPQGTAQPSHVNIDTNRVGYIKPIYIQTPCLTCHGEHIAKPLQQEISRRYPNDQAVNYKKGQFRGLFWAERKL